MWDLYLKYNKSTFNNRKNYYKIITWSGYIWKVKAQYKEATDPGPNYFSDSYDSVYVDKLGNLHMKIRKINNVWYSSEIINTEQFGYGKYTVNI